MDNNIKIIKKFIDMYDKYDFSIIKPYLSENIIWYSSYSDTTYNGLQKLENEYYTRKLQTLKQSKTKILNYSIIKFKDKLVSLGKQTVVVKGKEENNANVMVQQPSNGLCARLGQFYRSNETNSVNLVDALFSIEFNKENKISKISVLNDIFLQKGEYEVLEYERINDAWERGIPYYNEGDLLKGQELLQFGIETIIPYVQEEGYEIISVNGNINMHPHIVAKKENILCGIYVEVGTYPNHPEINEIIKEKMYQFAEKFKANIYYAPVSFMSIDKERADAGILLKYDGTYCNYKGLEEIK